MLKTIRPMLACFICTALVCLSLNTGPFQPTSQASAATMDELNAQVTKTSNAYNSAVAEQERIAAKITKLNKRIRYIEKLLPKQQARSNSSVKAMYIYRLTSMNMVGVLLSAESITDALNILEDYNWIAEYNEKQVQATAKLKKSLVKNRKDLKAEKASADATAQEAKEALASAQAARKEAQEEAAARQAAEAAKAKKKAKTAKAKRKVATQTQEVSTSNVDWSSDKTAFVNKWAPRINSYLAGSPMAGTGETYASAAWDNGVDPRWAPAISYVESGKGAVCFASYNAWGFGGSGFSSWADGINTVVAALGTSTYGGYLTMAAAKTYCPPNASSWYSKCAAQMASI